MDTMRILGYVIGGGLATQILSFGVDAIGRLTGAKFDYRDSLEARVAQQGERISNLEERWREEAWARMKAEAMLMRLFNSHNNMREEQGLSPIDYEDLEQEVMDPRDFRKGKEASTL